MINPGDHVELMSSDGNLCAKYVNGDIVDAIVLCVYEDGGFDTNLYVGIDCKNFYTTNMSVIGEYWDSYNDPSYVSKNFSNVEKHDDISTKYVSGSEVRYILNDIKSYIRTHWGAWVSSRNIVTHIPREVEAPALVTVERPCGSQCVLCKDWVHFADPNQNDGSFICYPCLQNPYRAKYP